MPFERTALGFFTAEADIFYVDQRRAWSRIRLPEYLSIGFTMTGEAHLKGLFE